MHTKTVLSLSKWDPKKIKSLIHNISFIHMLNSNMPMRNTGYEVIFCLVVKIEPC